jgi:hypothetical protein
MDHPWNHARLDEEIALVTKHLSSCAISLSHSEELLIVAQDQLFLSRLRLEQLDALEAASRARWGRGQ